MEEFFGQEHVEEMTGKWEIRTYGGRTYGRIYGTGWHLHVHHTCLCTLKDTAEVTEFSNQVDKLTRETEEAEIPKI